MYILYILVLLIPFFFYSSFESFLTDSYSSIRKYERTVIHTRDFSFRFCAKHLLRIFNVLFQAGTKTERDRAVENSRIRSSISHKCIHIRSSPTSFKRSTLQPILCYISLVFINLSAFFKLILILVYDVCSPSSPWLS